VEEVLGRQKASVQQFLVRTSILDRLCAPLCNAVTGSENGQEMLDHLQSANLFVVPLDESRTVVQIPPPVFRLVARSPAEDAG